MPRAASAATSALTWSRTEITGNREPQGFPSGASELGPVDPRQPPSTLVDTAHQRSVSIGAPGPATPSHQPGVGWSGPAGPVMWESPVSACSTTTTLSRVGDSSPHRCTAMVTSGRTVPFSRSSAPMFTSPISPSAGRFAGGRSGDTVGISVIVTVFFSRNRSHRRRCFGGSIAERTRGGETLLQVGEDVFDALEAHGQTYQAGGDTGGQLLLGVELLVGGRGRVDHQGPDVADVG